VLIDKSVRDIRLAARRVGWGKLVNVGAYVICVCVYMRVYTCEGYVIRVCVCVCVCKRVKGMLFVCIYMRVYTCEGYKQLVDGHRQ
jgi:hypothetical protein